MKNMRVLVFLILILLPSVLALEISNPVPSSLNIVIGKSERFTMEIDNNQNKTMICNASAKGDNGDRFVINFDETYFSLNPENNKKIITGEIFIPLDFKEESRIYTQNICIICGGTSDCESYIFIKILESEDNLGLENIPWVGLIVLVGILLLIAMLVVLQKESVVRKEEEEKKEERKTNKK